MLKTYFDRPDALRRLSSGCTGPHIDAFATALSALGYSRRGGRRLIRGVSHLGHWLDTRGVTLAALDEATLEAFVADVGRTARGQGKRMSCLAGARCFLRWAREHGTVSTPRPGAEIPSLIADFEVWMGAYRNLSPVTLHNYRLPLRRFLDAAGEDPKGFDASTIRRFILGEAEHAGRGSAKVAVSAIRMLLRYLVVLGHCPPGLVDAVPSVAHWKLAPLPSYLSNEEVDRLIKACDPATVAGRRDRPMVLLMSRLGLRSGDVLGLRLGDVLWKAATVAVSGKGRRSVQMPLPQDVGDAMLAWLSNGRPQGYGDRVFLSLRVPVRPMTNVAVNNVVVRASRRAGLQRRRVGPHMLRHSAATTLLKDGMSLAAIGALLRHQSLDTTAIYAKVDTDLLASVARPWPYEVAR